MSAVTSWVRTVHFGRSFKISEAWFSQLRVKLHLKQQLYAKNKRESYCGLLHGTWMGFIQQGHVRTSSTVFSICVCVCVCVCVHMSALLWVQVHLFVLSENIYDLRRLKTLVKCAQWKSLFRHNEIDLATLLFVHKPLLLAVAPAVEREESMSIGVWKMECPLQPHCSWATESWASSLVFLNLSFSSIKLEENYLFQEWFCYEDYRQRKEKISLKCLTQGTPIPNFLSLISPCFFLLQVKSSPFSAFSH